MRCRVPILLCALLVCSAALGAVPAAGQQQVDGTHLEVQLQTDGDAAWNVTVRMPIAVRLKLYLLVASAHLFLSDAWRGPPRRRAVGVSTQQEGGPTQQWLFGGLPLTHISQPAGVRRLSDGVPSLTR